MTEKYVVMPLKNLQLYHKEFIAEVEGKNPTEKRVEKRLERGLKRDNFVVLDIDSDLMQCDDCFLCDTHLQKLLSVSRRK